MQRRKTRPSGLHPRAETPHGSACWPLRYTGEAFQLAAHASRCSDSKQLRCDAPVVGDNNERVDVAPQGFDAVRRLVAAPPALEREWVRDHAHRQDALSVMEPGSGVSNTRSCKHENHLASRCPSSHGDMCSVSSAKHRSLRPKPASRPVSPRNWSKFTCSAASGLRLQCKLRPWPGVHCIVPLAEAVLQRTSAGKVLAVGIAQRETLTCSLLSFATTGAAPVPVPPPMPAVMNTCAIQNRDQAALTVLEALLNDTLANQDVSTSYTHGGGLSVHHS